MWSYEQEFVATVATIELAKLSWPQHTKDIESVTSFREPYEYGQIPLLFLLVCQGHSALQGERPVRLSHPRQLIDSNGLQSEVGVFPEALVAAWKSGRNSGIHWSYLASSHQPFPRL